MRSATCHKPNGCNRRWARGIPGFRLPWDRLWASYPPSGEGTGYFALLMALGLALVGTSRPQAPRWEFLVPYRRSCDLFGQEIMVRRGLGLGGQHPGTHTTITRNGHGQVMTTSQHVTNGTLPVAGCHRR
jgi:hypothetical protein